MSAQPRRRPMTQNNRHLQLVNQEQEHVTISDFSDRELIQVMFDLGGYGFIRAREMALRLFGIPDLEERHEEISHAHKCVSIRLSWMKRFGLVEKNEEERGEWMISEAGKAIREARLSSGIAPGINKAKEETGPELAHLVGEKLVKSGKVTGRAMQRELQFQITRRKRSPNY